MAKYVMPFTKEAEDKIASSSSSPSSPQESQNQYVMPTGFLSPEAFSSLEKQRAEAIPTASKEPVRSVTELPSLLDVGISSLLGEKVSKKDKLLASAAILATPDTEGQINILRNYAKDDLTVATDEKGNKIVNIGGRVAMVNKPGVDLFDVAQFTGMAALSAPAGAAGVGAAGLGAAALRSGIASAANQALISAGTQLAGRQAQLSQLGGEIAAAGIGGAAGEVGGRLLSAAIARRSGGAINAADEAALRQAAQDSGLSIDEISDSLISQARAQATSAVSPEQRLALQGEQEFNIPLTVGQRQGSIEGASQLSLEERMKTGMLGEQAQQTMLEFGTRGGTQSEAINAAKEALVNRLTFGKDVSVGRQATGEAVSQAVQEQEAAAKKIVDEAYGSIGQAELTGDGFIGLLQATKNAVKGITFPKEKEVVPSANALNKQINSALKFFSGKQVAQVKPADLKRIDDVRKAINAYYNSAANPTDRRSLKAMLNAFDDYVDSAVARNLFTGDPESVQALKSARGAFVDYSKKFRAQPVKTPSGTIQDPVGKFVERIIAEDPNGTQVVNAIFGAEGLSAKAGQKMARRIKDIVGQDSDAWMSLKREAFERLIKTEKFNDKYYISGAKTLTAIKNAQEKNSELLKEMFTPDELSTIKRFAIQVKRTEPDFIKSRENPSGTAQVASKALMDLVSKVKKIANFSGNLGITAASTGIEMVGGLSNRARARAAIRPFQEIIPAPTGAVGIGSAAAQQANQEARMQEALRQNPPAITVTRGQ